MTIPNRLLAIALAILQSGKAAAEASPGVWAEVRVVDAATGRGVPLVELETVHGVRFVTDNAGRVALAEPDLLDREVFFFVRSHGYRVDKDGFGYAGVRVTPRVGRPATVRVTRTMPAERLGRLTGEGRFRDSTLLGHAIPAPARGPHGNVVGQDSVQAAIYRGRVHWFWGDTQRIGYPLGLFRVAGATSPIPGPEFDPTDGIAFEYFTDPKTGFARAMMPLPERPDGVVWVFATFVVPDADGRERLVAYYTRRKNLAEELEQGIAVYDDATATFAPALQLPRGETWRKPSGHPVFVEEEGRTWVLFGSPNPNVRVPATLADVLNPDRYEALTCARPGATPPEPLNEADGKPAWRWQKELPPTTSRSERAWLRENTIRVDECRFCPTDGEGRPVELHSGSVRWNAFRKRWVLVACEIGGAGSHLGEVWYAEADHPTGPFRAAVKIATHDRQSFYNVCHHAFLDRDGGRVIHFEGTYTHDFSGNPDKTPRYNYNQIFYRLDLAAPALGPAQGR